MRDLQPTRKAHSAPEPQPCRTLWSAPLACVLACLSPAAAAAADPAWLVVPVDVSGSANQASVLVRDVERALAAHGLRVLDAAAAAAAFEREHSRAAHEVQPSEIVGLDALVQELELQVAAEDSAGVNSALAALARVPVELLDQRNHDAQRARRALRACVAAAFVFDRKGGARAMQEQLSTCARDFPGLDLELAQNSDPARDFLKRARALLAHTSPSVLRIETEAVRGTARCYARINGIDRGGTPVVLDQLRAPQLRVQVECGKQAGRVYTLGLSQPSQTLRVDPAFDAALVSAAGLKLSYADLASADALRVKHGVVLARAVGAGQLLQLLQGKLRRIDVASGRELVSAAVSSRDQVPSAVEFVLSNGEHIAPTRAAAESQTRSADSAERSSRVETSSDAEPEPTHRERRGPPSRAFRTLGYVGVGLTLAAAAVTIVSWQAHERHVDRFNDRIECTDSDVSDLTPACKSELERADSAQTLMIAGAIAGGASLVLSCVFFLIDANRPRDREGFACGAGPGALGIGCRASF